MRVIAGRFMSFYVKDLCYNNTVCSYASCGSESVCITETPLGKMFSKAFSGSFCLSDMML